MSWSYSGDPTSSQRDELRFILQDTDITLPLLQNEELDYLLGVWLPRYDSVTFVAAVGAAVIARKFAGVVNVSADGVSVDVSNVSERYSVISAQLRAEYLEAQDTGATVDISNIMVGFHEDWDIAPLTFSKGMHDNLYAGQQDYGGEQVIVLEWPNDGGLATG